MPAKSTNPAVPLTVYMNPSLLTQLEARATIQERTIEAQVRWLIRKDLELFSSNLNSLHLTSENSEEVLHS